MNTSKNSLKKISQRSCAFMHRYMGANLQNRPVVYAAKSFYSSLKRMPPTTANSKNCTHSTLKTCAASTRRKHWSDHYPLRSLKWHSMLQLMNFNKNLCHQTKDWPYYHRPSFFLQIIGVPWSTIVYT